MKKIEILSADFETTTVVRKENESDTDYRERIKKFLPKIHSWAVASRKKIQDYSIHDGISVFSFIDYCLNIKKDSIMYFHNGGRFDLHYLIPYLYTVGLKQLIIIPKNLSKFSDYKFDDIDLKKYKNITFEEEYRKLKSGEFSLLVNKDTKVLELKLAIKSTKRKKDNTYENRVLIIRDSNLMFPSSLKQYGVTLNKEYQTDIYTKLDSDYLRTKLYKNYDEFFNDDKEREYLHRDVIILLEFLYYMSNVIPFNKWKITGSATTYYIWKYDFFGKKLLQENIDNGKVIIFMTTNGITKYNFKDNKGKAKSSRVIIDKLFLNIFPVSWMNSFTIDGYNVNYNFVHKAYLGGLSGANPKYAGKVIEYVGYVDINSDYPTQMVTRDFPIGIPTYGDDGSKESLKIIDLKIVNTTNPNGIPFLYDLKKVKSGKHYPKNLKWKDYRLTDYEFNLFKKYYQGEYDSEVVLSFNKISGKKLFGDFIDYFYKLKSKKKSYAETIYAKLMLNSLYGKFGQDITRESKLYLNNEWKTFETIEETKFYLPIAVFITSYARGYLIEMIDNKFKNIVNYDTDSALIKLPKEIYYSDTKIINKYLEDNYYLKIDPKKLGCWDIEELINEVVARRAKQYMYINKENKKVIKYAGLRLNEEQLKTLSFNDFVYGKKGFEQKRAFRTTTGVILEQYKKEIKPIWEYDLNPDYWFKDEKSFRLNVNKV